MAKRLSRAAYNNLPPSKRVLVALMNNRRDFAIARDQHWYRIPVKSAPRGIDSKYIAFYQTSAFGAEKWSIRYRAEVEKLETVRRVELLPDEAHHPHAEEKYFKLHLRDLEQLEYPIVSRRGRRIVFIPTTLAKFNLATEINDLFHESPLEDLLWEQLKRMHLTAERQFYLTVNKARYCLDFALFCVNGFIDVECDGDQWHSDKPQIASDNQRNNDLSSGGWSVLRFNTLQLQGQMDHCLETIRRTVRSRGGLLAEGFDDSFSSHVHEQMAFPF
jgi:very-short-patch-repair endonuclease